uniref:Uncharacterized protein n=1 Tax=Strombidium inclinatum TaxID=197538 RepID=A0A7S3N0W5_9SPIT
MRVDCLNGSYVFPDHHVLTHVDPLRDLLLLKLQAIVSRGGCIVLGGLAELAQIYGADYRGLHLLPWNSLVQLGVYDQMMARAFLPLEDIRVEASLPLDVVVQVFLIPFWVPPFEI